MQRIHQFDIETSEPDSSFLRAKRKYNEAQQSFEGNVRVLLQVPGARSDALNIQIADACIKTGMLCVEGLSNLSGPLFDGDAAIKDSNFSFIYTHHQAAVESFECLRGHLAVRSILNRPELPVGPNHVGALYESCKSLISVLEEVINENISWDEMLS